MNKFYHRVGLLSIGVLKRGRGYITNFEPNPSASAFFVLKNFSLIYFSDLKQTSTKVYVQFSQRLFSPVDLA